jgi:iron complex outermembrane recepter protein
VVRKLIYTKTKILVFLVFALSFGSTMAQNKISSSVFDASTGQPLSGASISLGTNKTTSDKDGNFSIDCAEGKINFSFIGYKSVAITIFNCQLPEKIFLVQDETTLETVEVSTISTLDKPLLFRPASITKIGKTELARGNGLFLDDVIQTNFTGVSMNRRSVSGGQQLNIRGYGNGIRGTRGLSSNFDGQGYKVYLNGIAITDAEGITTFDDIDFESLQNVEVIKGPSGTLYGLAIAGVVNLTSIKTEKGKTSISSKSLAGNYGLRRQTFTLQTSGERTSLLVNYGIQKSDGFMPHNKSKKKFVNVIGEFQPNEKQTINTYAGYSDSYDQRGGELTITQFETNDYSGNPEYIKRNAHSNVTTYRAGIGNTYNFNKFIANTTTVFGTAFNSNVSSAGGWTDKGAINVGYRSVFNTKFNLTEKVSMGGVTGVESQKQIANTMGYSMKQNPNDTSPTWTLGVNPYWVINTGTSNVYTIASTTSLFTEWTLGLPKDFSITVGFGSSKLALTLNDRFNTTLTTRPSNFEKTYKNMVSPNIALNKVFNKKVSIFANFSKGYKAPLTSYFYITTPAVATTPPTPANGSLNEVLQPEFGTQFEIGSRGQLFNDKLWYELIGFNTIFENKMTVISVASPISPKTTLYSYVVNGGQQIHKGLEANIKYTAYESNSGLVRLFRPFANMTLSDFKYGDNFTIQKSVILTEDFSNKEVAAVAKYVVNAGLDFSLAEGFYGNLTYNYRDKMPITSQNDYYTKAYSLLNGKIGYHQDLGKHFTLDASWGVNNITNTKYFIMVFANQLPDAYVPAPTKANSFGSLELKYIF